MQATRYEREGMNACSKAILKWAQTKERVLITVENADLANHKVELKPEGKLYYSYTLPPSLLFSGVQGTKTFVADIVMFDEIDVEKSKWSAKGRNTIFNIAKKKTGTFWPRLLKDSKKDPTIKVKHKEIACSRLIGISGLIQMMKRRSQLKIGTQTR